MSRWRSVPAVLACVLVITVAGCDDDSGSGQPRSATDASTGQPGPRPLTADEAQRLSTTRFISFAAGVRSLSFEVTDAGKRYAVDGWADFQAGLGYATLRDASPGSDEPPELIAWTGEAISSHPLTDNPDAPPIPPPAESGWTSSALVPETSRLHAALAIVLQTASDRPDNPLLLRQTDARWLRSDSLDGIPLDVVAGPTSDHVYDPATSDSAGDGSDATVRYWIDPDSRLVRLEVRLGGSGDWTVVDLADAPGVDFASAFNPGTGQ